MKKKILTLALTALTLVTFTACGTTTADKGGTTEKELKTIVVGATPSPHAEILKQVQPILKEEGYNLEIKEYTDYVQPNLAVDNGDLEANYFQHITYLEGFNEENKTHLVSVGSVHYEPFGIYAGKTKSLDELKDGATVAVPNDTTNEARALLLLEQEGLIQLKEGAGLNATKNDIEENTKNLKIIEAEAAQIPHSLQDVDIAVINGNYALGAGLNVGKDALAIEDSGSESVQAYKNVLVVKEGNEDKEEVKALIKALQSEEIQTFMKENYDGA
ncbi:MAG TPA: metal ABC transporter substrate-binding protein, partial [Lachnospiraceae bacterium]|nr:metal ABC transporter substrate-binding protein [Lachnospiraceae bacterium]